MPQHQFDLDKLLSRVDLPDLARHAGAQLRTSGKEARGACPLHEGDNRTAFRVYRPNGAARKVWRCFTGCQDGGDAITFVQRWQNLDFVDAVKWLTEYAHLSLTEIGFTPEAAQAANERRQRSDVLDETARYFAARLWEKNEQDAGLANLHGSGSSAESAALAYLHGRGFSDETIRGAGWGYTRSDTGLRAHLDAENCDLGLAGELGILRKDGRDFTANAKGRQASPGGYIVFPHQVNGRTVYFSARALDPVNAKDKSRNLPGSRQVYWALASGHPDLVIVEGQADAESLRQLGHSALGLCGVGGIPEDDLHRLRQRRSIYLALDNDDFLQAISTEEREKHRQNKAQTTARLCADLGPLTMVVPDLPAKDFNELLQAGLSAAGDEDNPAASLKRMSGEVDKLLRGATPWIDILLGRVKGSTPHDLAELTEKIISALKGIPEALQPRYYQKAQRRLGMTRRELRTLMRPDRSENGQPRILADVKGGQLCFLGEPLGNFTPRITHELTVDDGTNLPTVRYTISGRLASGEVLSPLVVDADEFIDMKWVHRHWGARPILYVPTGQRYKVVRAIQEVSLEDMVRERVYTYTGWTLIDGERSYLSGSGRITAQGFEKDVRVDLGSNNMSYYALPEPPSGEALLQAVRASLDFLDLGPPRIMSPLWAAMYAAPLTEIRALYSLLWLYGPTQSGKSTIAHLALTHFGTGFIEDQQYHAPIDWLSTITALEGAMFTTKDAAIVIDDFTPQFSSASDARKLHRMAHKVVRAVGNRAARSRSTANLEERKTRIPRGMVLVTSELPLSGESTRGRMIQVPFERGDVLPREGEPPREALDRAQRLAQGGMYAQAMAAYVQWLARNWERVVEQVPDMVEASRLIVRKEVPQLQNRLPDYFAQLNTGQMLALRAFQDMEMISGQEAKRLAEVNRQGILEIISSQAAQIAAESPVRKWFEALDNLLERRKVFLAPRIQRLEFVPPAQADQIGWFEPGDPDTVYLNDSTCLKHAREFWADLGEYFDTTIDTMRRQISQIGGLLVERDKRQLMVPVWAGGQTRRLLKVNGKRAAELYGVVLRNGQVSSEDELPVVRLDEPTS